jgi:hypothetical protein
MTSLVKTILVVNSLSQRKYDKSKRRVGSMKKNLAKFMLLLMVLAFGTVALTGCGGGSSSSDPVTPADNSDNNAASLTGDDDGDGRVMLFASSADIHTDFEAGVDFGGLDDWDLGTYTVEALAPYDQVAKVTILGNARDTDDIGVFGFHTFNPTGILDSNGYTHLNFKFYSDDLNGVTVKFVGGNINVSSGCIVTNTEISSQIGDSGWYEFRVPLTKFPLIIGQEEEMTFVYQNSQGDGIADGLKFYITDVYFD